MKEITLGAPERSVLLTLMAAGRRISNPELRERVGIVLNGAQRRRLNDLKLVDSELSGRSYVHELTDKGWAWCTSELSAEPPARAGSYGKALYAVLASLGRYLDAADLSLAEYINAGRQVNDLPAAVRAAYWTLVREPQDWVSLARLRPLLAEYPREDIDAALRAMEQQPDVHLAAEADQKTLTAADREAALTVGGATRHLLAIEAR